VRRPVRISLLLAGLLACGGCATVSDAIDAMNPFAASGPKMAELTSFTPTVEIKPEWRASLGKAGNYVLVPAVVGGSVFVADGEGNLVRFDNGAQAWRINAGQSLSGGVGSDGKLVVVGTPKGDVLAFAAQDGKPLWQAKVSSEVLAPPAVGDNGVAVRSGDNRISLLDVADGKRKWIYQRPTPSLSLRSIAAPVFSDRYVFAGFPGGKLVALALNNGGPVWEGTVALPKGATELDRVADVVAPPVVDGRQVCAAAFQGRVACFDLGQGGNLLWARDFSSAAGIALDGRYLFLTDDNGAVHALDRSSGASVWKQDKLAHRRVSGPAVRRGLVAVGDAKGVLHFLSREDGSFAARYNAEGGAIAAAPQVVGSGFLIQTQGGGVAALGVE